MSGTPKKTSFHHFISRTLSATHIKRVQKDPFIAYDYRRAPFREETWWYPNEEEKEMIRDSWTNDEKVKKQLGVDVFEHIKTHLNSRKGFNKLYPKIAGEPQHMKRVHEFEMQAIQFSVTMDFVITHLDEERELDRYLSKIGQTHVQFVSRGFRASLWELFKPALMQGVAKMLHSTQHYYDADQLSRIMDAWGRLAVMVVRMMFNGFCRVLSEVNNSQLPESQKSLVFDTACRNPQVGHQTPLVMPKNTSKVIMMKGQPYLVN